MSYRKNNYMPKSKNKWAKILTAVACVLVVCALCGLIPNFFNHKDGDFERVYVGWNVGGLTDVGKFDPDVKDSMVSDPIDLDGGLKIKPDFESGFTYYLYFYDEDDSFVKSYGPPLNTNVTIQVDEFDSSYEAVDHYRIVLKPVDKNNIIDVVEKYKYANLLEIFRAPLEDDVTEE